MDKLQKNEKVASLRCRKQFFFKRLSLFGLILVTVGALFWIAGLLSVFLTHAFTAPTPVPAEGNSFMFTYRSEVYPTSSDSLSEVVLEPIRNLLSSAMNLLGLQANDKTRSKRDLEQDNRLSLVDHNQLDKEDQSSENGFVSAAPNMATQTKRTLRIMYAPLGNDQIHHNDIIRSLKRRKRRSLRDKRYASAIKELEIEYSRCKKEVPKERDCEKIYEKLKKLSEGINKNFVAMSNLIHDFQGKQTADLAKELIDSFPKKDQNKTKDKHKDKHGLKDSDENGERKSMKKDKPDVPQPSNWPTVSALPSNLQPVTEIMATTTEQPNTRLPTAQLQAKNVTDNVDVQTLDDLIHSIRSSFMNDSKQPEHFNPANHNPITDDCVKNLDQLLETLEDFKTGNITKHNCTKTQHLTIPHPGDLRFANPTVSHSKQFPYKAEDHRPHVDECIQTLDDLMDTALFKKPRKCTPKSPSSSQRNIPDTTIDTLHNQFGQPPHPIHEELSDHSTEPQDIHDYIMSRSRNRYQYNHDYVDHRFPTTIEAPDSRTTKQMSTLAASGPFLELCNQYRSQPNQQRPLNTVSSNHHNFQAQQFGSGGFGQPNIPITGETLKASSHVSFNSAYGGFVPNHFCFYQLPQQYGAVRPGYGGAQTNPGGQTKQNPPYLVNDPSIDGLIEPRSHEKGIINVPVNIHNIPGQRSAGDIPPGSQLICNIVPAKTTTESYHSRSIGQPTPQDGGIEPRITSANVSSGTEPTPHQDSLRAHGNRRRHCVRGWIPCANGQQCIRNSEWCDSKTDCLDGSDEAHCSCLSRISEKRLCDGYADCPLGEDEMGCFGCDKFSYSCFNNAAEHETAHKSGSMCFTAIEKCDGFDNCLNRKDEHDCNMLVKDLGSPLAFAVGHSQGILHRNHKGKWYPVCHNPTVLARDACESEIGPLDHDPQITQRQGHLQGPFIQPSLQSPHVFHPEFLESCNGFFTYVLCPQPKCGTTKLNEFPSARIKIRNKRSNPDEVVESTRIVGGTYAEPSAFPFIVAIFRDGRFHCGGSIFNEHWIISAAHCCDNYDKHYYELRAGMLRKHSYASHVQVSLVTHVIVHQGYSADKMINDISLMRSDRPFAFNRWVRPICLPDRHRTTNDRDWKWGPKPGTLCTAIGWGAVREHGGAPDHLKQVSVPILSYCKHKTDREGLEICAAEEDGGQDACQGDSGGPFVCVSITNPHEWYLSGVVSHGEGCARANEPGVYTRVSLYIDWIHQKVNEPLPQITAQLTCPGFHCTWGTPVCLPAEKRCNGVVNCLGGEDEGQCPADHMTGIFLNRTNGETVSNATTPMTTTLKSSTTTSSKARMDEPVAQMPANITNTVIVSPVDDSTSKSEVTEQTTTSKVNLTTTTSGSVTKTQHTTVPSTTISSATLINLTTVRNASIPTSTIRTREATEEIIGASKEPSTTDSTTTVTSTTASDTTAADTTTSDTTASDTTASDTTPATEPVWIQVNKTLTNLHTHIPSSRLPNETTTEESVQAPSDNQDQIQFTKTESNITVTSTTATDTTDSDTTTADTTDADTTTATEPVWIQINKTLTNLHTHIPSSRLPNETTTEESVQAQPKEQNEMQFTKSIQSTSQEQDIIRFTTDAVPETSPFELLQKSSEPVQRNQEITETPHQLEAQPIEPIDHHHDLEQSETQIRESTGNAQLHPFFGQLVDMHEARHRRLNQFRLSANSLHTSLKNYTSLNDTYRYKRFSCKNIHQTINLAHYCDRVIDCEDGTDEMNCTCREYLQNKYSFLICDGKTDCLDQTDEKDCFTCEAGQYSCRMSKMCIDEKQYCDDSPHCPLHEDELDCLALTNGRRAIFDANGLSMFNHEGFVTKNTKGTWNVLCGIEITNKTAEAVGKICSILGFAGYLNYSNVILDNTEIDSSFDKHTPLIKSYQNVSSEPNCKALRIVCVPYINATEHEISHFENQHKELPVQINIHPLNPIENPHLHPHITFNENAHIEFIENFGDDYDWPWNADIYFEGLFLCSAVVIDVNWIIVDSTCMRLINLKHDYISVVAGGAKSYLKIAGPYEQVSRVDCYHFLPEAKVVMLHLENRLNFTRHVLPTFIPKKNHNIEDNQCLAVGQDKLGRTRTLRVHLNMTDCTEEKHICYKRDPQRDHYHAEHCYSESASRSGVIVCKTKHSGWYPVGFYQNKQGLCGFNEVVKIISLKEFFDEIQHVLGHQKCDYEFNPPPCAGTRCRYGKCIEKSMLCDGKLDCSDGSDELPELCANHNSTIAACHPAEFRCNTGQCVAKNRFCDGHNDCGDLSDEPHECSCYTYLKITDPSKICDGFRNCWDKSDENPRLCKCSSNSFRCGESGTCVPFDFVCDGEIDCPGSEDEKYCYALQQNPAETNYGEVMQQSFGIWHSKCFPKNVKYDDQTIKEICESIGYNRIAKVYGRKMLHESRLRTANSTDSPVDRLRKAATKAVVLNKFSKVLINEKQSYFMKPSRPMFKLVNWDEHDNQNCDRLEVNCGD